MAKRLRLVVQKSTVVDGGTPVLETRHFLQAVAGVDCNTDAAAFLALDNKQAQTTPDVPVNLPNKHWNPRGCAPSGDTYADTSNDDYTPPPGGGNGNNPLPTDGSAWTAGNPNDVDDTGTSVTFSTPVILTDD
ncbi:hypothetical protein [Spirosoma endbachense]|uniref:Uncharacterized protein n=1 Tax=Spirosoma endbachense TaxID=2666025 RepID=A0A6P1VSU5_9BACT|nr:hypothetical protein [Spirosoma endbachense]QHV96301.1 hypothetical protein GJR95_15310 [Spirosoma endbachense]